MLPAIPLVSIYMHACLKIRYAIAVLKPLLSFYVYLEVKPTDYHGRLQIDVYFKNCHEMKRKERGLF
jgi:hypothetical protein